MNIVEPNYGLHDTSNNRQSSANLGKVIEEQDTYVIKSQENWDENEFCSDKPVVTESNRGYIEQNDQYLEEEKMKYDSINHDLGLNIFVTFIYNKLILIGKVVFWLILLRAELLNKIG